MKEILMTILRDKTTSRAAYREAAEKLAVLLALEAAAWLPRKKVSIQTPLAESEGVRFSHNVVLVPILRSGLALLYPFLKDFPEARVGFIGMRRDEVTAEPHNYYVNLPPLSREDRVLVLEPMIATGGSGIAALALLMDAGIAPEHILYVGVIAATEGLEKIRTHYPRVEIIVAQTDSALNSAKFIVPGLGDFGDRYFGT